MQKKLQGKMKGQFFILGAVLICAVFFVGLPLYGPQVQGYKKDISFALDNLESEFPIALNLGLKSGNHQGLTDFSRFSQASLAGQDIQSRSLWLVAQPESQGLQVTIGNFMGQSQDVTVTIEGQPQSILVQDNSTGSLSFAGVPDRFQISIDFPGHSHPGSWLRDKANMYAYLELSRGNDIVIKEIDA